MSHIEVGHTRIVQRFSAPAEHVFDAWLDPGKLRAWMFEPESRGVLRIRVDARVGGSFAFIERHDGRDVVVSGEYLELARPRRLVCTWITDQDSSRQERLTIDVKALSPGCELSLTHETYRTTAAAWGRLLEALSRTLALPRQHLAHI